jgi:hypothetical protein
MMMTEENERYTRVVSILRNSRPGLNKPEEVENEIISKIKSHKEKGSRISEFIEAIFGWVYIGWVRRSLIGVSAVLISIFVYQQAFIFRQVKEISKQIVITGNESSAVSSPVLDKRLTLYKMSSRISPAGEIRISESQLEDLLDSYNELQVKYKDLMRILEENPDLKKSIEKKLKEEKNDKPEI